MKSLLILTLLSACAVSASHGEDGSAENVAPTKFVGSAPKRQRLISSDLNGRELQFITSALQARGTLAYLATETRASQNASLRSLGEELQKNLPSQTAVLSTLAEMRNVQAPESAARQQQALEMKLSSVKGARFEKALMDALLDANTAFVTACEAGLRSTDASVRQFAEQTLPYASGTLARVQAMAGIAPRRSPAAAAPPPVGAGPAAAPKPGFRTNIRAKESED